MNHDDGGLVMGESPDKGWCRVSLMGHKTYCGYVATDGGLERVQIFAAPRFAPCPECDGLGGVDGEPCGECDGEGTLLAEPVSVRWFGAAAVYEIERISETEAVAFVQRQIAERERAERWAREREERAAQLALERGDEDDVEDVEEVPW